MTIPSVEITVTDNGVNTALVLPVNSLQLVMGCALAGTVGQIVATTNPATIQSTFVGGPLCEAAGMVCAAGGTVLALRVAQNAAGTAQTPVFTGSGTASANIAVTLDGTFGAYDDYYVRLVCTKGGTLSNAGSSGIQFQVSLDAGRNYSPVITLAANALTYVIPGTGITVTLGQNGDTYVAGDAIQFQTVAPAWNAAGVQAALQAFGASQYGIAGVGSMHLAGIAAGTDCTTIEGYLDALFAQFIFQRLLVSLRDAHAPTEWGGAGETEAAWLSALATSVAAVSAKRIDADGGYYNMPSAFANSTYGTVFSYRRPLSWAHAVRRVLIPPQRRAGRVKDGSLGSIVVNPPVDGTDGFIYHDERVNPGLDAARIGSAMTWPKKSGFYMCQERLLSPLGSQYTELVLGNVIDLACAIGYQEGVNEVSDDLRLNQNGTLYANDANSLQNDIQSAIDTDMTNAAMISSATVSVSQTANVGSTGKIPIGISVLPRGYVNEIDETIGLQVPGAAPAGG